MLVNWLTASCPARKHFQAKQQALKFGSLCVAKSFGTEYHTSSQWCSPLASQGSHLPCRHHWDHLETTWEVGNPRANLNSLAVSCPAAQHVKAQFPPRAHEGMPVTGCWSLGFSLAKKKCVDLCGIFKWKDVKSTNISGLLQTALCPE